MSCDHCGDSGVLNVVSSREEFMPEWDPTPYATACHCEAGDLWVEVGLVDC